MLEGLSPLPRSADGELDSILHSGDGVVVGAFRCPTAHPRFADSGPIQNDIFVFPRSSVRIRHAGGPAFVADHTLADQGQDFVAQPFTKLASGRTEGFDVGELRDHWSKMTDTHEFFGMLKKLDIDRRAAVRSVGEDYAWKLADGVAEEFFRNAVETQVNLMCFVANRGIVQIHTGPVNNVAPMGPWLNVMDPTFHLHLRADHIAEAWAVRKPTRDGHVTSVEAYDRNGDMIIQFFGKRKEGNVEMAEWRALVEGLSTTDAAAAA